MLLGVGVGWAKEEFDALGIDFAARGKRTDEAIEAMRRLWLDEAATYAGDHFAFREAYSFPKPAREGGIPVLIGGRANRQCDASHALATAGCHTICPWRTRQASSPN